MNDSAKDDNDVAINWESPVTSIDPKDYLHFLDEYDLTEERKLEIIDALSHIAQHFVDQAWGIDSTSLVMKEREAEKLRPDYQERKRGKGKKAKTKISAKERSISTALTDEDNAFPSGTHKTHIFDVRGLRKQLGLSQKEFSSFYGIPLSNVRSWERGLSTPDAIAVSYLNAISRSPAETRVASRT